MAVSPATSSRTAATAASRDSGPGGHRRIAIGNHALQNTLSGHYEIDGKPTCCPEGQQCWSGTTSVETSITIPQYGTLQGHIEANVVWKGVPGDPTGSVFQPTGSATYSAHGDFGACTAVLQATTFPITENEGTLQFMPGTPLQYLANGSTAGPPGSVVNYDFMCNDGSSFTCPATSSPGS